MQRVDKFGIVLFALGLVLMANAVWMLLAPASWYQELPAGVPDTGPLNPHFVRDIGATYLTVGAGLLWAARQREFRLPLVAVAALFHVLHAATHVLDTMNGRLPSRHWLIDFPGVYLPTLALMAATVFAWRSHESR
jgi:hypothetical protein